LDLASTALKEAENLAKLSQVASQYGPFFFSVLFVVFVPVMGQRWLFKALESKDLARESKAKVRQVYTWYWLSGVVMGLVLTTASVLWWIYVQITYVLPAEDRAQASLERVNETKSEEVIRTRISEELSRRIFEGVIVGVSEEDMFVYDFSNPYYKLYVYPVTNQVPMVDRFIIIFTGELPKHPIVLFRYMNRRTYEALLANRVGYVPLDIKFCPDPGKREIQLVKDAENTPPHFDVQCSE
jgi:hypothetical protein